jgi:predicted Fe-Mo cluster-binding NifX family protein
MKICIPVAEYRGLDSPVYGHFGSAPSFVLVDADTMVVERLDNHDQGHVHGQCSPVKALAGARPEVVVVGGIGAGAVLGLRNAGIRVYQATGGTVGETVALFKKGELQEIDSQHACPGHGEDSGCQHSHD